MLIAALLLAAAPALAVVNVTAAPASLVATSTTVNANTTVPLFSFSLGQDASETLTSVAVTVSNETGSTASSADLAAIKVLKGTEFSSATEIGSNATVNLGSSTAIAINSASNAIAAAGDKFFVALVTGASWAQPDKVTVTLPVAAIVTSANSPAITAVTTAAISAPITDTTGPVLTSVVATNKSGSIAGLEAGDYVTLTFGEPTNKPVIDATNVNSVLLLTNSHSWLDGVNSIGGSVWNTEGTALKLTMSSGNSLPTLLIGDTVTVTGSVIKDAMGNNATGSVAITGSFAVVDSTAPLLKSVVAYNKAGGSETKEAGDYVVVTFNEATNAPAISKSNINSVLALNNSHSWLDGAGELGAAVWNDVKTALTVTLSGATSLPTLAIDDTVTIYGSVIKDVAGNAATGSLAITGSFKTETSSDTDDFGKECGVIKNGWLYRIEGSDTVYLAAGCKLKPFRGAAVFKARGHKFQDIKVLTAAQTAAVTISNKPALPAGGTLVKGSKATVWFVTEEGKIKGFVSEKAFKRLGFNFGSVKTISDSDLSEMGVSSNIEEFSEHPEGTVLKCTVSTTVYMVKSGKKYAFTNPQPYLDRGHTWDSIANVDCQQFQYQQGTNITQ